MAYAYARMLTEDMHNGQTYNLHGEAITQSQLADYMSDAYGVDLSYTSMSVEAYREERVAELGDFIGTVIAGIYQGIREGKSNNPSQFSIAAGREHISWQDFFDGIKAST